MGGTKSDISATAAGVRFAEADNRALRQTAPTQAGAATTYN